MGNFLGDKVQRHQLTVKKCIHLQILREIDLGKFKTPKTTISLFSGGLKLIFR